MSYLNGHLVHLLEAMEQTCFMSDFKFSLFFNLFLHVPNVKVRYSIREHILLILLGEALCETKGKQGFFM